MNTVKYVDADGKINQVAVTDEVYETIQQLDKQDESDTRRETRRCQSLEASVDNGFDVADPNADVEEIVYRKQRYKALYSALAKLPRTQRELVEKVFFERISQTEIARQEGVSRYAISKRIARILMKLKKLLS